MEKLKSDSQEKEPIPPDTTEIGPLPKKTREKPSDKPEEYPETKSNPGLNP